MKIEIENVSKTFKDKEVVKEISFAVNRGRIVGLLGPNGAGKTTTLRMILNILKPDSGSITFDDQRMNRKIRDQIGYLPEERGLYQKYAVLDVLLYFGRLKNLTRRKSHVEAVRLLDGFQMIDYMDEPIGHLSKGLQQKLQFLVSLIHNPEILIMDEPMWGLDPINQEMVKQKILSLRDEGKTILISTHQLAEAETMCDHFVLINHGEAVLKGSLEKIRKNVYQKMIIVETDQDLEALKKISRVRKVDIHNKKAHLYLDGESSVKDVMREIINTIDVVSMEAHKPSLLDIFMQTIKSPEK
ncbi:MAG: ATP-binding cassette domain-containing protein [bacterium]|nr:MAG: ATP-binding cassette domain-containing protein [bacterium]